MKYELDRSIQKQVQKIIQWDEATWSQYVYDCGIIYLEKVMPEYPQVSIQISKSIVFWNWWKHHWEQRDREFLESIDYEPHPLIDHKEIYKEHHDPRTLAEAIYLSGQVLQESYAEMIGTITKSQTTKKEVA